MKIRIVGLLAACSFAVAPIAAGQNKGLENVSKEAGKALIGKTDQEKHEANVERDLDKSKSDYERLQKEKQYERTHRDGYEKPAKEKQD